MLNSKALAFYGITAATPTPVGGVIGREPGSRSPTASFRNGIPADLRQGTGPSDDELVELITTGQNLYLREGITTAQEGATMKHQLDLLRLIAGRGLLRPRRRRPALHHRHRQGVSRRSAAGRTHLYRPAANRRREDRDGRLAAGPHGRIHHA